MYTVEEREDTKDWEQERHTLQSQLDQLEEEIVKIENGVEDEDTEEEEEAEEVDIMLQDSERSKEERKLQAHVRVLEMQLTKSNLQHERNAQRYKQEIIRQSQVIQKLHMYLATQHYDNTSLNPDMENNNRAISQNYNDNEDSISVTSAGQFERGDLSATKEIMKCNMANTENELENKLKLLVDKGAQNSEYNLHMQKLQVRITYLAILYNVYLYSKICIVYWE